jgi:hypothetical protein
MMSLAVQMQRLGLWPRAGSRTCYDLSARAFAQSDYGAGQGVL